MDLESGVMDLIIVTGRTDIRGGKFRYGKNTLLEEEEQPKNRQRNLVHQSET